MRILTRAAVTAGAMALMASPAMAVPPIATDNPGTPHRQANQPSATPNQGSNPGTARRLAAPGQYCRDQSRRHVAGMRGTPFSQCVVAQARLRRGQTRSPAVACRGESKRRVAGQRGTPFSRCVVAGARLLRDMNAQSAG